MQVVIGFLAIAAIVGIIKPYIKGWTRWYFVAALLGTVVLSAIFAPPSSDSVATAQKGSDTKVAVAAGDDGKKATASVAAPSEPASKWRYTEDTDEMRGTKTHYAMLTSENEVEFEFPYHGGSTAEIQVRQRPEDGLQVMMSVSSGQFMCNSFSNTTVSVKFDDKPIRTFGCNDTSSGDSDVIFIQRPATFLSALKDADKVIVEPEFYQAGRNQFTFDTRGLKWE